MNASIDKPDDIWKKTLWPLSRDYIYALLLREFRLICDITFITLDGSTYAPYCDSHPCGQVSVDKNEFKRGYQTIVFVAGMANNFQVFSQLIGYAIFQTTSVVSILSWLKHS